MRMWEFLHRAVQSAVHLFSARNSNRGELFQLMEPRILFDLDPVIHTLTWKGPNRAAPSGDLLVTTNWTDDQPGGIPAGGINNTPGNANTPAQLFKLIFDSLNGSE